MESKTQFLLEPEAVQKLAQYHILYPAHDLAQEPEEAVQIAERIGYPVVLKIVSRDAVHKSDMGGVKVNLIHADQVRSAYTQIVDNVLAHNSQADIDGVLVVRQASEGLEVIIGALEDPTFGPTIMFGLGGVFAEVLKDVTFRIAPLERGDAEEMVQEIKGYPLLQGVRGSTSRDIEAIIDLLMAVSRMVTENPEIKELDLNPVRVYEQGLMVLDARMMVASQA